MSQLIGNGGSVHSNISAELACMASLRDEMSEVLRNDEAGDILPLLTTHGEHVKAVVAGLAQLRSGAETTAILDAVRGAGRELAELVALIELQQKLAGTQLRRTAELRKALGGYSPRPALAVELGEGSSIIG